MLNTLFSLFFLIILHVVEDIANLFHRYFDAIVIFNDAKRFFHRFDKRYFFFRKIFYIRIRFNALSGNQTFNQATDMHIQAYTSIIRQANLQIILQLINGIGDMF